MTSSLRIIDEPVGFDPSELVACPRCLKQNGPDRNACLYCGETLPVTTRNSDDSNVRLRKLEGWEPAFNLVMHSNPMVIDSNISAASQLVDVDTNVLDSIIRSGSPMPVARVESESLAGVVARGVSELGFISVIISDADLKIERPPVRLRNLAIDANHLILTDFNSGNIIRIERENVVLIVTGRIVETRRDEVTKRKKGKTKVLDETETGSDLQLIDLYVTKDVIGYRIQTNGFDFSVLGEDKSILASKNIEKLAGFLKQHCPNAVMADEYDDIRSLLDVVWEPESRKEVHGLHLGTSGKREFGATYTSSNLSQFTKYSRMRRLLI